MKWIWIVILSFCLLSGCTKTQEKEIGNPPAETMPLENGSFRLQEVEIDGRKIDKEGNPIESTPASP